MKAVGSVGLVGSWFLSWATRSCRNVWSLSSWLRGFDGELPACAPAAAPVASDVLGTMVMVFPFGNLAGSEAEVDAPGSRPGAGCREGGAVDVGVVVDPGLALSDFGL